ncbi:D-serine ammonia-lyase [uncultured Halopseudomonas sp.]|uniref:D-serine ammonia-lyase n=1 Tax=uncultured Halopseudomonas sp. TaxID=2901193 RepID=UPI0030EBEF53|tara:strand:- start:9074 stop:10330 length:1257 start_codon:yes stop_codon:yes gene_type:complete
MLATELVTDLQSLLPMLWLNPGLRTLDDPFDPQLVDQAQQRMRRAGALLARVIPELEGTEGLIESPLLDAAALRDALGGQSTWLFKADNRLPLAGSVKARGGVHEVLEFAEATALAHGWSGEDFAELASPRWRETFAAHRLVVGSTGNLAISIGLMSRALGFQAQVHMSREASEWKKSLLRDQGVEVIEHDGDYAAAVAAGRSSAQTDPQAHFVDDERSVSLFCGYATAAQELARQLQEASIEVSRERPLMVYLPCGVGGAPGGITYGLKQTFGDAVHCWFAEPLASPSVLLQMAAGADQRISVYDLGLDNKTFADGLAVGQASMIAAACMQDRLSGVFTVGDSALIYYLRAAWEMLGEKIEPSAAASFAGPGWLTGSAAGAEWCVRHRVDPGAATHLLWSTGGNLVPQEQFQVWLDS